MERRCPICGASNPKDATVCPCGTILVSQKSEDLQQFLSRRVRNLLLWAAIFLVIVAVIALLRRASGLPSGIGPSQPGRWQMRDLKNARVSLETPGPFKTLSLEQLGVPLKVRNTILRADTYVYRGPGLGVVVQRLLPKDPNAIVGTPMQNNASIPAGASARLRAFATGSHYGSMLEVHLTQRGKAIEVRNMMVGVPPELWIVRISNLELDTKAAAAARRILGSIRFDGHPIQFIESSRQGLHEESRPVTLIPGALSAAAPVGWVRTERAALAPDEQIPCRPSDARYFMCQCGPVNMVVGTGTCDEDPSREPGDMLPPVPNVTPPTPTVSSAAVAATAPAPTSTGILVGRRAVVRLTVYELSGRKWMWRSVLAADGHRMWLFSATYPADDHASKELVDRVQDSVQDH